MFYRKYVLLRCRKKSTGFRPNLLVKILKSTGQTCQICHMYAIVVKFHLKYDQTPGFQNYKFGLGQESKMAAITKNSKTIKINVFSGTIRYNWL